MLFKKIYQPRRFSVLSPFSTNEPAKGFVSIYELREEEVGLHSSNYEKLFGSRMKSTRFVPSKRGILKVTSVCACGNRLVLYRRYRGSNIYADAARVAPTSYQALRSMHEHQSSSLEIEICAAPKYIGRFLFYWFHPDDAARVSFRIGVLGFLLMLVCTSWSDVYHQFEWLWRWISS
jgi:hypothetical protein